MTVQRFLFIPVLAMVMLSGCARMPWTPLVDVEPLVIPELPTSQKDGSIYQQIRGSLVLFEDRRPRNIGDVITIQFNEEVNATKSVSSNTSRNSSMALTMENLAAALASIEEFQIGGIESDNQFNASGGASANNEFSGTLTVQVHKIYPNGNLFVAGEKKIVINKGTEFIRFSGIVNPRNITGTNTVPSSEVADAKIEYVGNGYMNDAQRMGWFQRVMMKISPF